MKRKFSLLTCLFFCGFAYYSHIGATNADIDVYFSPKGGCQVVIINEINQAKKEILVQAYIFTSDAIAQALVQAKKRGLTIKIILDSTQLKAKNSKVGLLDSGKIKIYVEKPRGLAHNKVIIIDDGIVITGSYNFTNAAEYNNEENLLLIRSKEINNIYRENFSKCLKASNKYLLKEIINQPFTDEYLKNSLRIKRLFIRT